MPDRASGVTTCRPLPPVVLQKAFMPSFSRRSLRSRAASTTRTNFTSGAGSRSKTSRPGTLRMARLAVPRVQFDAAHLRCSDQRLHAVELEIGLSIPRDLDEADQVRSAGHRMALEESLAADAVRNAHERTRPSLQVLDHPGTGLLEILREIELGHRFRIAGIGPKRLVGVRNRYAEYGVACGTRLRGASRRSLATGFRDFFHAHLPRRLVCAQALERGLPNHPGARPAGEFDLGDELRPDPAHVRRFGRRAFAAERAFRARERLQSRLEAPSSIVGRNLYRFFPRTGAGDRRRRPPGASAAGPPAASTRRSRPRDPRGTLSSARYRPGPNGTARRGASKPPLRATCGRPIAGVRLRRFRSAPHI